MIEIDFLKALSSGGGWDGQLHLIITKIDIFNDPNMNIWTFKRYRFFFLFAHLVYRWKNPFTSHPDKWVSLKGCERGMGSGSPVLASGLGADLGWVACSTVSFRREVPRAWRRGKGAGVECTRPKWGCLRKCHILHGTHAKMLFIVYLKFNLNWASFTHTC